MDKSNRRNKNRSKRPETEAQIQKKTGVIKGYEYEIKDLKKNEIAVGKTKVDNITVPIKIKTDGEYAVTIRAIDEAGNRSETRTINVYKDEVAPEVGTPQTRNHTGKGFIITVGARDTLSGIAKYECYVDGIKRGESETNTIQATGLEPLTIYDNVTVKVYDNAGNVNETLPISITTKEGLQEPTVTVEGTKGPGTDGNYYRGEVKVKIKDNGGTEYSTDKIRYTINGKDYTEVARGIGDITVAIPNDGSYTVKAYAKDIAGNTSGASNTVTFIRDTVAPTGTLEITTTTTTTQKKITATENGSRNI